MPVTSLYWHDYETFGIDPRRDRPAQFAGLRTDEELNPVGDPLVLYCHPPTDRLPSPEACLVTGIAPQQALALGVCEARFIAAIHGELSVPGTCGLGYNSIRFDDEVTRNLLYRNFYDPYEREWRDGNSRWDIIDMVRLTAALRPEGIEWPRDAQGIPSFRLELLTEANGIGHAGAHDAWSDVRATLELARLLKTRQPKLFDFVWRNRGKREAAELLKFGSFEPILHVSEKYAAERGCIAVVTAVARHPDNQNEIVVYDLSVDVSSLLDLGVQEIQARVFTRAADLPQGVERIPLKTVHLNKCPVIAPIGALRPADAERLGIDLNVCRANARRLKAAAGLAAKLSQVFARPRVENGEPDDPDRMIYRGGFFSRADKAKMTCVREMSPEQLATANLRFDDSRLAEMLFRYRARNWPETLNETELARWEAFRRSNLEGRNAVGVSAMVEYEERLAQLLGQPEVTARDRKLLESLSAWGHSLEQ